MFFCLINSFDDNYDDNINYDERIDNAFYYLSLVFIFLDFMFFLIFTVLKYK
jgi:hypothetical protein